MRRQYVEQCSDFSVCYAVDRDKHVPLYVLHNQHDPWEEYRYKNVIASRLQIFLILLVVCVVMMPPILYWVLG